MARVSGLSGYLHLAFMETPWKEMYLGITFFSGLFRFICRSGGSVVNPAHGFNRTMGLPLLIMKPQVGFVLAPWYIRRLTRKQIIGTALITIFIFGNMFSNQANLVI